MANTKYIFLGCTDDCKDHELEAYVMQNGMMFIQIDMKSHYPDWIELDKDTAIKLVKHLKSQINLME